MFAITGITGQVGSKLAIELRTAGHAVRAVLRDEAKATAWVERGCETALASMDDTGALRRAFTGAEAVFVLLPPHFDPTPGFPEVRGYLVALGDALREAAPKRVVCLSTIGAQATQENLLSQLGLMEQALTKLPMPVAFLRAAWFMENAAMDVDSAQRLGVISTFLHPSDKPVPMVATIDIARLAATMLQDQWTGTRIVELEGPGRVTPDELAATFGRVLRRDVQALPVPRATWDALFRSQGMSNPTPRMRMLDGFNEGWIDFEHGPSATRKGTTT
ncbi:MAG: NmrA family transcriptional regulator, partial [Variovorax sp.]|nr:NmrA family transcriptional regulator [Variovorax sp.]